MSDVNPWISQDTWFEILKKLRVKTLGKCRCVCKSWNTLIVSQSFMDAHFKVYTQNEANSVLLFKDISIPEGYDQYVFFRDSAQFTAGNSSLHTSGYLANRCQLRSDKSLATLPFRLFSKRWHCYRLVGSVYGLLCLLDHFNPTTSDRFLIWNPLLQKSIKLPLTSIADERPETRFVYDDMNNHHGVVAGFGYDDRKNDHRVVKISHFLVQDGEPPTTPLIEICSVKERIWKMVSADYLVCNCIRDISSSNCFFSGVIHWITESGFNFSFDKWLLLYNVMEEVFDRMELPEVLVTEHTSDIGNFGIFEYQSKLSVSLCKYIFSDGDPVSCQIWVKGENNAGSSWCKILHVLMHDCWHTSPVQYLGRDEELLGFFKKSTGEMVSYESKTKQIKGLGRYDVESTRFIAYSECLVLLDQEIAALTCDELQMY